MNLANIYMASSTLKGIVVVGRKHPCPTNHMHLLIFVDHKKVQTRLELVEPGLVLTSCGLSVWVPGSS